MSYQVLLTKSEVALAEAIARDLAPYVDRNELGKVVDFFRRSRSKTQFTTLLNALPRSGYVRSQRTTDYYKRIRDACQKHLAGVDNDRRALAIVGWSFRLMTYEQTLKGQRYAYNR
jgi:hypothetical protein